MSVTFPGTKSTQGSDEHCLRKRGIMSAKSDTFSIYRLAGLAALFSGILQLTYLIFDVLLTGVIANLSVENALGRILMVAWSLLLIPTVTGLMVWLQQRRILLPLLYSVLGVLSLLMWAYGAATGRLSPTLQASSLLLASIWWMGIGAEMSERRKYLGAYTFFVGVAALLEIMVAFIEPFSRVTWLGELRLPVVLVWSLWIGLELLLNPPERQPNNAHEPAY
jgi:hypothetical protein